MGLTDALKNTFDYTIDTLKNNFNINGDIVPKNRILIIKKDGKNILSSATKTPTLYIDGEFPFKVSSTYKSFLPSSGSSLMTLLGGTQISIGKKSTTLGAGQYGIQGAQIWQETSPLNLSFNCHLYMNEDAYIDVVSPCKKLLETILPKEISGSKTKQLIPPGPNLKTLIDASGFGESYDTVLNVLNTHSQIEFDQDTQGMYTLEWGNFVLNQCIITSADPTFSETVDDDGYPTSVNISLEVTTAFIPTTQMIDEVFRKRTL